MEGREYKLIGACFGLGASIRSTELGPKYLFNSKAFKASKLYNLLSSPYIATHDELVATLNVPIGELRLPFVENFCLYLAKVAYKIVTNDKFPIIIGGDHSIAIGSWSGIIEALQLHEDFGMIWIDACLDAHTEETSDNKAYNSMPVATLLGYGNRKLTHLIGFMPKFKRNQIVMIGTRYYDNEELELLDRLNIKIFFMHDILQLGLTTVFEEAIKIVTKHSEKFGLSLDLNVFDPLDAPGVGIPIKDGISRSEFFENLPIIAKHKSLAGIEIVEFNPKFDKQNKTLNLLIEILENVVL